MTSHTDELIAADALEEVTGGIRKSYIHNRDEARNYLRSLKRHGFAKEKAIELTGRQFPIGHAKVKAPREICLMADEVYAEP